MHILLLFLAISTSLSCISINSTTEFDDKIVAWSRSIAQTFNIAQNKSFFEVDIDKAITKALDTFMKDIDSHGSFLSPEHYQELLKTTHGEFYGIGVVLAPKKENDDFLTILDCVEGSPAEKQGVKRNDKIIAIDGALVSSLEMEDAIKKLKGQERYSKLSLDILRDKQLLTVVLKRDIIKEDNVVCYYLPDAQIAYCSLSVFTQEAARDLKDKILSLQKSKLKGIILDLRDNPGGILQTAADCASLFLPDKSLVATTKTKDNKETETFYTSGKPLLLHTPVIILVNNFTASAGEILAGTLQYYAQKNNKRMVPIFLAGTKTHGKGSVQEVIPISNKCAVKITTSLYYLPNNVSINNKGLTPDFIIEPKIELSDTQKKLTSLLGYEQKSTKLPDTKDIKQTKVQLLAKDHFVQTAINILNSINLGLKTHPAKLADHQSLVNWVKKYVIVNDNFTIQEIKQ